MTAVVSVPLITVLAVRSVTGDAGDVGSAFEVRFGSTMFYDVGQESSAFTFSMSSILNKFTFRTAPKMSILQIRPIRFTFTV